MIGTLLTSVCLLLTFFSVSSGRLDEESTRLRVRVVSGNSPLVGATVSLSGGGFLNKDTSEYQQYTDDAGYCEFTHLSAGTYSLRVSKLSFFSPSETSTIESTLVVKSGETKVVQSDLAKGGVVTGRLMNADYEGLTGIPVTALRIDSTNPQSFHEPPRSESNVTSVSDDRGIFRIYGLRPGSYVIAINAQREASLRRDILPLKYLGNSDSKSTASVFIGFSEEIKLPDIQLTANLGDAYSISGTVVGKGNLPLAAAVVSLQSLDDQTLSDKSLTSSTGDFTFEGLVPGRYKITASSKQGAYRSSVKNVDLGRVRARNLVINLSEYSAIEGRSYLFRNEKPEPLPLLNIALRTIDGGDGIDFASGSDGTFSVKTTRTGSFFWNLPGLAKNQYLDHVAFGDKDITSSPLVIGDKSISDIAIYVSTGAAGIEGRFPESVQNGCKAFTVYAVLLSSRDNALLRWKRPNSCIGSSFAIYSLPPGRYFLVALPLAKPEEAREKNSSGLPKYQSEAIRAVLKDSERNQGEVITLDKGQLVSGRAPFLLSIAGQRR